MRRASGERWLISTFSILVVAFLIAPSAMIIAASVNHSATLTFPPQAVTIEWYRTALATLLGGESGSARDSLVTSLLVGLASATTATVVGVLAAYALVRFRFPLRGALEQLVSLPLVFPSVSFGVGLLILINTTELDLPFGRLILGCTILSIPFVVRNATASLTGIGRSVEEAAWLLGASRVRAFVKIVLPLSRPGILAGFVLSFIISFNEFTVSFFLYTPSARPFSIWVFQRIEAAFDTSLTAIGTLILAINLLLLWALRALSGARRWSST